MIFQFDISSVYCQKFQLTLKVSNINNPVQSAG